MIAYQIHNFPDYIVVLITGIVSAKLQLRWNVTSQNINR